MQMLRCSKCENVKPSSAFNSNSHNESGHDHMCKLCRSEYMRKWNKKHGPQRYKRKYKEQWTAIIRDLFGEVKCQDCGWNKEPAILEWHHEQEHEKETTPSRIFSQKPNKERIYEILTCIPLCPTCHRLRHFKTMKDRAKSDD